MKSTINEAAAKKRGVIRLWLSVPFIYGMAFPTMVLHACLFLYQQTAFRLYGIEIVSIKPYITDIRRYLPYLNFVEKAHCWYCTYTNGVYAYAVEVAARTEKMWCPIKNADQRMLADLKHREKFAEYGNAESLKQFLQSN